MEVPYVAKSLTEGGGKVLRKFQLQLPAPAHTIDPENRQIKLTYKLRTVLQKLPGWYPAGDTDTAVFDDDDELRRREKTADSIE